MWPWWHRPCLFWCGRCWWLSDQLWWCWFQSTEWVYELLAVASMGCRYEAIGDLNVTGLKLGFSNSTCW